MWEGRFEIDETETEGSCWSDHWEALIQQEWGCGTAAKETDTRLVLPGDRRFSGKGVMMPSSEVDNSKITKRQGMVVLSITLALGGVRVGGSQVHKFEANLDHETRTTPPHLKIMG